MDITISKDVLDEWAGLSESEPRYNYSGRSMYGELCVGIVFNGSGGELGFDLVDALISYDGLEPQDAVDTAREIMRRARTDNMGMSTIMYFPGVQIEPEESPHDVGDYSDVN